MRASPDIADPIELLTPRERECLRLVDRHLSSKQIARELGIAETTVKTHLTRVFGKTGLNRQADLVRLVAGFAGPLAH